MAYVHRSLGQVVSVLVPNEEPKDPLPPSSRPQTPSPMDLGPAPVVDTSKPAIPLPAWIARAQTPAAPVVPLPPMTSSAQTAAPGRFISSDGLFGVQWKWWLLGGVVLLVVRGSRGGTSPAVTPNSRRRRNRSR